MRRLDRTAPSGRAPAAHGLRVTVLASGSAGNAILLECGGGRVLVDAGVSVETLERALGRVRLSVCDVGAVVLTHEHDDHARGAGPLSRTSGVPVYATRATAAAAGASLAGARLVPFEAGAPFAIGPLELTAFPVPHDAAEPVGLAVAAAGRRVVIATDLGTVDEQLDRHLAEADLAVLESNYDLGLLHVSGYPWFLKNRILGGRGHLSNDEAARGVCLVHLSEANNLAPLARDTVLRALEAAGAAAATLLAVRPNGFNDPLLVDW